MVFTTDHRRQLAAGLPSVEHGPAPGTTVGHPARHEHQALRAKVQAWASQNHIEEQLLPYRWSVVTPTQHIVILADRGLARASLFRWVRQRQRPVGIRFDGDTWLRLPDWSAGAVAEGLARRPGQCRRLPQAWDGKDDRGPVAGLALCEVGQKGPGYLATNHHEAESTESCYRRRMRIEAGC
jgi:hypothetical protein